MFLKTFTDQYGAGVHFSHAIPGRTEIDVLWNCITVL